MSKLFKRSYERHLFSKQHRLKRAKTDFWHFRRAVWTMFKETPLLFESVSVSRRFSKLGIVLAALQPKEFLEKVVAIGSHLQLAVNNDRPFGFFLYYLVDHSPFGSLLFATYCRWLFPSAHPFPKHRIQLVYDVLKREGFIAFEFCVKERFWLVRKREGQYPRR